VKVRVNIAATKVLNNKKERNLSMRKKAIVIGFVWFLFASITSEIAYRISLNSYGNPTSFDDLLSEYPNVVSWPAALIYEEAVNIKMLKLIQENNLSDFKSEGLPDITNESIKTLSEIQLFTLQNEMYELGYDINLDIAEEYAIYIIPCTFPGIILYLIVCFYDFRQSKRNRLDKD